MTNLAMTTFGIIGSAGRMGQALQAAIHAAGHTPLGTDKGGAYQTMYVGCIGSLQFLRTTTINYLDGI